MYFIYKIQVGCGFRCSEEMPSDFPYVVDTVAND